VTLFEMAVLDRELRRDGLSIRSLWPKRYDTATQATVSLIDDEADWQVHPSVARVRVKTQPGVLSSSVLAKVGQLDRPILLDFNCSANDDHDVLGQVQQLQSVAMLDGVEQPFAPGNVIDHARLGEQLDVPISLDEGVRSGRDLEQIVRYHAAQLVCIKPARVGGYANAKTMVLRAKELGLEAYLGGFFESGFARTLHRTFAHHLVTQPSDLGTVETELSGTDVIDVPLGFEVAPAPRVLERAHRLVLAL
jgi:O-succinylbenzoate synthase